MTAIMVVARTVNADTGPGVVRTFTFALTISLKLSILSLLSLIFRGTAVVPAMASAAPDTVVAADTEAETVAVDVTDASSSAVE